MQDKIIANPCISYRPGHSVHWIQANHAQRAEYSQVSGRWVEISVYGTITIEFQNKNVTLWNHNPIWLARFEDFSEGPMSYQPEVNLLWLRAPGDSRISQMLCVAKGDEDHAPCRFHPPGTVFGELFD